MDRIATAGLHRSILASNQDNLAHIALYQRQLATGKKIEQISDDPSAGRQLLRYRNDSAAAGTYLANVDRTTTLLNASESAIDQMSTTLDQVRAAAVQGANGATDAAGRAALSRSVDGMLSRLIDLANTKHDGRYLFAGAASATRPFARSADDSHVEYQGDLDSLTVRIGPDTSVTLDHDGHALFQGENDVFAAVISLRDALAQGDSAAVADRLAAVDAAHGRVNRAQGDLGGATQRLQMTRDQLEQSRTFLDTLASAAEDVDMTDAISKLQLAQIALEAGMQSGAKVAQRSLIDFLQ